MNVIYSCKPIKTSTVITTKAGQFGGLFNASGTSAIRVLDGTENSTQATQTLTLSGGTLTKAVTAQNTLTSSGVGMTPGSTITLGAVTYTFVAVLSGAPSEILIGATDPDTLQNLKYAVNLVAGQAGVTYGINTPANPSIWAYTLTSTTLIFVGLIPGASLNTVSTTCTDPEISFASATLGGSGATVVGVNGGTITIGTIIYAFVTILNETFGAPSVPYQVLWVTSDAVAMANLYEAVNRSGTAGTTYSVATSAHGLVQGTTTSGTTLVVTSILAGSAQNSIATTSTETHCTWGSTTLTGGSGAIGRVLMDTFTPVASTMYRTADIGLSFGLFVNLSGANNVSVFYV